MHAVPWAKPVGLYGLFMGLARRRRGRARRFPQIQELHRGCPEAKDVPLSYPPPQVAVAEGAQADARHVLAL